MTLPEIRRFEPGELAKAATQALATHIEQVTAERGVCRFALSGGGTPKKVYALMARLPIDWEKLRLFWGDERCVQPDDDNSNYKMAKEALLSRVSIPESNVFRIRGEDRPEDAALAYSDALGEEPIDILMLGMGDDGHTASLFPGEADLLSPERVIASKSPVAPRGRVTMTLKTINESRAVYFLIGGAGKSGRLADIEAQIAGGNPELPTARVQPASGRLVWLVDTEAAANLKR